MQLILATEDGKLILFDGEKTEEVFSVICERGLMGLWIDDYIYCSDNNRVYKLDKNFKLITRSRNHGAMFHHMYKKDGFVYTTATRTTIASHK